MKKILVLSDTHSHPLPEEVWEQTQNVDGILHAGDFTDIDVFHQLKKRSHIWAVYGNGDDASLRKILPRTCVVTIEDTRIALVHGEGAGTQVKMFARDIFQKEKVDVIVFGHSHMALNEMDEGVLMFNPGSSTDTIRAPFLSYGILEIHGEQVKGRIIKVKG